MHGDDGPFIVRRWWRIEWSRNWQCWKDHCCCTIWN